MQHQNRIQNPTTIDFDYIDKEIRSDKHVIVQFSEVLYNDKILSQLNELCKKYNESFGVRFYGHYSGAFDFMVLRKIPNVKCLYTDCLLIENIQTGNAESRKSELAFIPPGQHT